MLVGDVCYDMFGIMYHVGDCCMYVCDGCMLGGCWLLLLVVGVVCCVIGVCCGCLWLYVVDMW